MSQPSRIDFSSEDHASSLDSSCINVLLLSVSVIDSDVSSTPMAFLQVADSVNVVLVAIHAQLLPHESQSLNVSLIVTVKTILVFNLKQNDGAAVFCPERLKHRY